MYTSYHEIVTEIEFIFPHETGLNIQKNCLKHWTKGSLGTLCETKWVNSMIAWLAFCLEAHSVKHGGQNCVFGELTTWRLEFREAKAPGSCRPELRRRGGMQKKSLKILHRSSLVICMHGAKRDQLL